MEKGKSTGNETKKTLYVHIGTPKTGTTSIQNLLCWNRGLLEKKGYCYPDFRDLCPDYTVTKNGYFLVQPSAAETPEQREQEEQQRYREGMDRVVKLFLTYDNVILSDEAIYRATYKRRETLWQQLKEEGEIHGFAVKVIIFLRRQDLFITSRYNQNVKENVKSRGTGTKPWAKFIEPPYPKVWSLDYYERLEMIRAVLGRDAIIVRRFDRKYFYGGTLCSEFLHLLGLEFTDEYYLKKEELNQSLPGNTLEIMRLVNEMDTLSEEERLFFRKALFRDRELSSKYYKTSMFSKEEAEKFLEEFEEGNRKIAEEYFGDGDPLFHHEMPDLPKYDKNNEYMIDDVIRFTVYSMEMLMKENEQLRKEMEKKMNRLANKLLHPAKTIMKKLRK